MTRVLLWSCLLAAPAPLLTGCGSLAPRPAGYGDFIPSDLNTYWYPDSRLTTPAFKTDITRPVEFRAQNLPKRVNTAEADVKMSYDSLPDDPPPPGTDPRGGRLVIETFSLPEMTPLAVVIHDMRDGDRATPCPGNRPARSFLVRVTVERPYYPVEDVNVGYWIPGRPRESGGDAAP